MLTLTDNLCRLMLSIYDESEGTTKPVKRGIVLERLNLRKAAAGEEGRVTRNMVATLIAQLIEHNLVKKAGRSDIAAVVDVVGFRSYMLRKFVIAFCASSTYLLTDPAIQVIGVNNLKRHLHEH